MSSTSCGTRMLVLSTRVRSVVSLALTTFSASSVGTCVNRLVTSKLTIRFSGPVQTSRSSPRTWLSSLLCTRFVLTEGSGFWQGLWPVRRSETQCRIQWVSWVPRLYVLLVVRTFAGVQNIGVSGSHKGGHQCILPSGGASGIQWSPSLSLGLDRI